MPAANYEPEMRVDKLENRVKELEAQLSSVMADAERYRWIARQNTGMSTLGVFSQLAGKAYLGKYKLDEAIDKARGYPNDRTQPHEAR